MKLESFVLSATSSLREALVQIEHNQHGIILGIDSQGKVCGLATDGDVRRKLLAGASLADPVSSCLNPDFVWADLSTPRELLLKQLDNRIRSIPILDPARQLVGIVSRDNVPVAAEGPVYARARAPVRVSFGGGGSDLTNFFSDHGGAVINTTIAIYSHASLRVRADATVNIYSQDLGESLVAEDLSAALRSQGQFGLIQALLRTVQPDFGFDLYIHSDFRMKSGLGGSAVVAAAVLGCFNQLRQDRWDLHELAELAFQAERLYLGIAGGWQDQYATVFGGFNFMEFRMEQNVVHPLRIHPDVLLELEESLLLCDTGTTHESGDIHEDQKVESSRKEIRDLVKANVSLTYEIRDHLLRGRLVDVGHSLHRAWHLKRQFSKKISTPRLDHIYETARSNGALGGKLMGAGGGGYFVFFASPFEKQELSASLEAEGMTISPVRFEPDGLKAWSVREHGNKTDN